MLIRLSLLALLRQHGLSPWKCKRKLVSWAKLISSTMCENVILWRRDYIVVHSLNCFVHHFRVRGGDGVVVPIQQSPLKHVLSGWT